MSFNRTKEGVRKKVDAIDVQDGSRSSDVSYREAGIHRAYDSVLDGIGRWRRVRE